MHLRLCNKVWTRKCYRGLCSPRADSGAFDDDGRNGISWSPNRLDEGRHINGSTGTPGGSLVYTNNLPTHLVRALGPPRFAATVIIALALVTAACSDNQASSITSPPLSISMSKSPPPAAADFAVLANQAVTCTDGTINGDVGTFQATPTGSITLTGCTVTGGLHVGDGVAKKAFNSFLTTYAALAPKPKDHCTILTGTLAGAILSPGAYCFTAAAAPTGVLTLNGPSNGVWTFKIGTGGTGALSPTDFTVIMGGQGQACNVTWWVADAATMIRGAFQGNVLAGAGITTTDGTFNGNAWAKADFTNTGTLVTDPGGNCKKS